jgi:hypothetical protein
VALVINISSYHDHNNNKEVDDTMTSSSISHNSTAATPNRRYQPLSSKYHKEIHQLPEQRALLQIQRFLHKKTTETASSAVAQATAIFLLHVVTQSALMGRGFYTIGP